MEKDFQRWHEKKSLIDSAPSRILFREREIWWCTLGLNIGFEQNGSLKEFTRPVLILTKFNLDTCLVVPLTTQQKAGPYYFSLENIQGRKTIVILSQIRFIDRKRLLKKIAKLSAETFELLKTEIVTKCFPPLFERGQTEAVVDFDESDLKAL